MAGQVVVDASLAVKWLLPEEFTPEADALARLWTSQGVQMVAVHLMPMEVTNTLHQHIRRGLLSIEEAYEHLATLLTAGVQLYDAAPLHTRALELASELRQGAVYDAHYLALAESLGCELWTADRRFHRIAGEARYPVHWVGDYVTS